MKVAVTARGDSLDSEVDQRFGRASVFVVADTETGNFQVVDNTQNLQAAQGAGIQAAQTVVSSGAQAVITGHCGPKAFKALTAARVRVYTGARGSVAEAMSMLKNGELSEARNADVEGHW